MFLWYNLSKRRKLYEDKADIVKKFHFFDFLNIIVRGCFCCVCEKKEKKGKKSGKSSKSSGKKNVAVNDPQPSSQSQIPDARAGYANNMAGYARGRGAGQPQQQMTPEQEIENLTGKLMACLSPVCNGSISYEKCFQTSKLDLAFCFGSRLCVIFKCGK